MQPNLTAIAAEFSDVLSLLVLLCIVIVGLAASLVMLEAVRYDKYRRRAFGLTTLWRSENR
jgi:nitrate reductase gamma subunit